MKNATVVHGATVCRWFGRIIGTLLVTLTVYIGVGEGMPNPFTQPVEVQFGFFALALILIGILAGWRWEFWGGIISLLGWCFFVVVLVKLPRGLTWFAVALALPGALYVTSALLRRYYERHPSAS